ncbi:hypothetical protein [Ktedonobacter racemifer]|uniref:Uncharacterized protein n=1 Tax=Ktedonobacter racemifer DSM 44963 TaxID=485913 RepID=D6TCB0_KTERA|nr:hypothetical protein [Ktedonobacter racemifer]EFH89927.1 hypothetical protein Krac_11516 [Ktedonobacter racemifer DSM 44963]
MILPSQLQLFTLPAIAVHPRDGSVYVAYASYNVGTNYSEVMLTHATKGESTWCSPTSVFPNAATDEICYFQPQLAVSKAGIIAVSAFAYANERMNVVLARSRPQSLCLEGPVVVTDQPFDPELASSGGDFSWWIGNYQGLASGPGVFYPFWNDTRTGNLEIFVAAIT